MGDHNSFPSEQYPQSTDDQNKVRSLLFWRMRTQPATRELAQRLCEELPLIEREARLAEIERMLPDDDKSKGPTLLAFQVLGNHILAETAEQRTQYHSRHGVPPNDMLEQ